MDSDIMTLSLFNSYISRLSRFFSLAKYKLNRKKNLKLYRITFKKTSGLSPTHLVLISLNKSLPMHYSIKYNEYYIEIWLSAKTEFQIEQKGKKFLIDSYPQTCNSTGNIVNFTPEARKFSIFSRFSTKYFCISLWYYFDCSACSIGKTPSINEDAYFCNEKSLGIADGIGSLKSEFGISSHDFSHELMKKCKFITENLSKETQREISCKDILSKAYSSLEVGGGSTVLLTLLKKKNLNVYNLGDSGLVVLRNDKSFRTVFQTTPKIHKTKAPYQLTRRFSEKQMLEREGIKDNLDKADDINDADEFLISVYPGDYLVMGSDGLWDNMHHSEILKVINQYSSQSVKHLASIITKFAKIRSLGRTDLPFPLSLSEKSQGLVKGKPDDITVIVAKILA